MLNRQQSVSSRTARLLTQTLQHWAKLGYTPAADDLSVFYRTLGQVTQRCNPRDCRAALWGMSCLEVEPDTMVFDELSSIFHMASESATTFDLGVVVWAWGRVGAVPEAGGLEHVLALFLERDDVALRDLLYLLPGVGNV